jgi:hypothetical protein
LRFDVIENGFGLIAVSAIYQGSVLAEKLQVGNVGTRAPLGDERRHDDG